MQPVSRQDEKHDEIRNHHGQVKRVRVINTAKRSIRQLVPILDNRAFLDEEHMGEGQQV